MVSNIVYGYLLLVQIDDEVLFGLELPRKLRCMHHLYGPLFRLLDLLLLHD